MSAAYDFRLRTLHFLVLGFVRQEFVHELAQPRADFLAADVAELLAERPHRHHGLGHGAMSAGAADVREEAADEFAGVLRIAEVPPPPDQRSPHEAGRDGPIV